MPAPFVFRARSVVSAAALALLFANAAAVELPDAFRAMIETGIANGRFQGVAVALVDRDSHGEWMFGEVEPGGGKPTVDDAFEIGSTTRTFTGLLLARALVAGKVRLEDTLGTHFPDVRFADSQLKAVTLGQLATRVVAPRLGEPKLVPGPPKRFAQGMGATMTIAAVVLQAFGITPAVFAILGLMVVAAGLESLFATCLGCIVFGWLMRIGVIPEEICAECADISLRTAGATGSAA